MIDAEDHQGNTPQGSMDISSAANAPNQGGIQRVATPSLGNPPPSYKFNVNDKVRISEKAIRDIRCQTGVVTSPGGFAKGGRGRDKSNTMYNVKIDGEAFISYDLNIIEENLLALYDPSYQESGKLVARRTGNNKSARKTGGGGGV